MRQPPPLRAHRQVENGLSASYHMNDSLAGISSSSFSTPCEADSSSLSGDQDNDISEIELPSYQPGQYKGGSGLDENMSTHHTLMSELPVAGPSSQHSSSPGYIHTYNYPGVPSTFPQSDFAPASPNSVFTSHSGYTLDDDSMSGSDRNEGGALPSHPLQMDLDSTAQDHATSHAHHLAILDLDEIEMDEEDTELDSADDYEAAMEVMHSYAPNPMSNTGTHNNLSHLLELSGPTSMPLTPGYSLGSSYDFLPMPAFMDPSLPFPGAPPLAPGEEDLPPFMVSSGNVEISGSQNYGLLDFLRFWARYGSVPSRRYPILPSPNIHRMMDQINRNVRGVSYSDLDGDRCDIQGLDWENMGVTRKIARITRKASYKNYVNIMGSDSITPTQADTFIFPSENYFRYRRTVMRSDVHLSHFQLRSVLACPSRTQVYYATRRGINLLNPVTKKSHLAMNVRYLGAPERTVTALDATSEVLVGGTFNGDYCIKLIHAEDTQRPSEGQITGDSGAITTHIQIHTPRRSSSPVAAIASNDNGLRMLDLATERFVSETFYGSALNCSAISPDRRLRVVVGDTPHTSIVNADTGAVEVELKGHRDYGFSCDWSDDGVTVATGFQDKRVKIWDARKWTDSNGNGTPVMSILCDMSSARSLRFSPLGSGEPVLVAAEEADYINIIDAKTFLKKQTIDLFGEIGGVAFTQDGQELNVLVSDTRRGGLIQFDRCGLSQRGGWAPQSAPLNLF